ncbi:hypothetical protein ADUPG1_001931, partial [Aduncisulcus paluster]
MYLLRAPSNKIIRLSQYIFSFDLEFIQISGKENPIADYLSRLSSGSASLVKVVMPTKVESNELREYLLNFHHSPNQVHLPASTMILAIKKSGYIWEDIEKDVKRHCDECLLCQKTSGSPPTNALMGSTFRTKPFETVELDLIGPLPEDKYGYRYMLSMIDTFTRVSELATLRKKNAKSVAKEFLDHICLRYT